MQRLATCAFAAAILLVLFSSLSLAALRRPVSSPAEAELALDNLKEHYVEATDKTDWKLLAAKGEALMARYGDVGTPIRKPTKHPDGTYDPGWLRMGGRLSALIARFYFHAGQWEKLAALEQEVLASYKPWEQSEYLWPAATPHLFLDYALKHLGKPGLAPEGKPLTLELGDLLLPEVYRIAEPWVTPNPIHLPVFELALAMEARLQADLGKDFIALEWHGPRLPGTEELDLRTREGYYAYWERIREVGSDDSKHLVWQSPDRDDPLLLLGAWALAKDSTEALDIFNLGCERANLQQTLTEAQYYLDSGGRISLGSWPLWDARYREARERLLARAAAKSLVKVGGKQIRPPFIGGQPLWPLKLALGDQGGSHKWDLDEATGILAFTTLRSWQDTNEKGFRQYKSEPWHIGLTLGSTQAVVQGNLVELNSAPVLLEGEVWVGVEDAPLLLPDWECVWSEEKQLWSLGRKKTEPDSPTLFE